MDWGTHWLRPEAYTKGKIMDMIVLEQFLHSLPESVQVWVRWYLPGTVDVAVKLTEAYVETDLPQREGPLDQGRAGSPEP